MTGLVESPLPGNRHAGFGRRLGETHRWKHRQGAPGRPHFYLLEAEGFDLWLVNAKHVKNVPGRPKTDKIDAVWLAKVVERGMCSPSLVHPEPIRRLRDLTRYRRSLIRERTREKQRVEKLLEDAQIKLSSVITDIFGVSGREMLDSADRRATQPEGAGADGPRHDARQDRRAGGGVDRALRRPPRVPAADDAGPHRRADRADRRLGARIEELIAPFSQQVDTAG